MDKKKRRYMTVRAGKLLALACGGLMLGLLPQVGAQTEQRINVTIKGFAYVTNQAPLIPGVPTLISIKNEDDVRHDFGSLVFQGGLTQIESSGTISYGRGVEGVFLDPAHSAAIRFTVDRPGRYEFRCSIHPNMKGELLLLDIQAV